MSWLHSTHCSGMSVLAGSMRGRDLTLNNDIYDC